MQFFESPEALLDAVERGEAQRGDVVYIGAHRYARMDFSARARLWRGLRGRGVHLVTEAWVGEQLVLRGRRERYLQERADG